MLSALIAVGIAVVVGGLGLVAGFFGGLVDVLTARVVDVLLAIPSFLLAVVVVSSLGFRPSTPPSRPVSPPSPSSHA